MGKAEKTMEFLFSFNNKYEFIIVNDHLYKNNIGALITNVIDIDWESLQNQISEWVKNEIPVACWDKQVDAILDSLKCHHVVRLYLMEAVYKKTLPDKLKELSETKQKLVSILEFLVDENANDYISKLYEQFHDDVNCNVQTYFQVQKQVKTIPRQKQAIIKKQNPVEINIRFSTDNIEAIIFRELRFICANQFVIRKCAHCRRFFWTRTTNKVYCNRIVQGKKATCNQYGPRRKRQIEKRPAYNLYWNHRAKAFHTAIKQDDKLAFQAWIKEAQPYKSLARRGEISLEDMCDALVKIEQRIFPTGCSKNQKA